MEENSKYNSRKLIATALQWIAVIGVPILYKSLDLSETLIITVLATSTSLVTVYIGANVLQKKVESD